MSNSTRGTMDSSDEGRDRFDARLVGDIMQTRVVTIGPEEAAAAAWTRMRRRGIRHLVVVDHDDVVGVLSERDRDRSALSHQGCAQRTAERCVREPGLVAARRDQRRSRRCGARRASRRVAPAGGSGRPVDPVDFSNRRST